MNLQIHTETGLERMKLGELFQKEIMKYIKEHSNDCLAKVKCIIGLYAGELITAAEEAKVQLDLSYETIKNIPAALTIIYQAT